MRDEVQELLVLLRGTVKAGRLAAAAIVDTAVEEDLPGLAHVIITEHLISSSWATRSNAGHTLRLLSRRHAAPWALLLAASSQEGSLLTLDDIDLPRLLREESGALLLAGTGGAGGGDDNASNQHDPQAASQQLYGKAWLRKQKRELRRRLGMESEGTDVAAAVAYDGSTEVLSSEDIHSVRRDDRQGEGELQYSQRDGADEEEDDALSVESWLARLVRFMCVGLLAPRWETRHGSATGLAALVNGITGIGVGVGVAASSSNTSDSFLPSSSPPPPPPFAAFLARDLQATGVLLLALDRFVDFGRRGAAAAPVKEAAARLICVAALTLDSSHAQLLDMAMFLAGYSTAWVVQQGGLHLLKYLLTVNFRLPDALRKTCKEEQVVQIVLDGLKDVADDVRGAAAQVVGAMAVTISPTTLLQLVQHVADACTQLTNMSGSVSDIAETLIRASSVRALSLGGLDLCAQLSCAAAALIARQALFSPTLRAFCLARVSDMLTAIAAYICALPAPISSQKVSESKVKVQLVTTQAALLHLLCIALGTASASSARSMGDLHLVDKAEQGRKMAVSVEERDIADAEAGSGSTGGGDGGGDGGGGGRTPHRRRRRRRRADASQSPRLCFHQGGVWRQRWRGGRNKKAQHGVRRRRRGRRRRSARTWRTRLADPTRARGRGGGG